MSYVIDIQNLTKYYGKTRGVENLSLQVEEGEIFGFIGPNGAGKSTAIRVMLDLIRPTSGKVSVFGADCRAQGVEIRREIGYLPSEVFYYENMRVKELLDYSASFYGKDCSARMRELADTLQLDLGRKIDELSFGNRKKVGIVQGLLHSPRLIILDEPTGGLDPLMQQKFFDLLVEENKKGVTVFFSSHILSEVQRICHRVAIIKNGSIVEVQQTGKLRENSYSKVRFSARDFNMESFSLSGVSNMSVRDGQVEFLYRGRADTLVTALAGLPLQSIWIEEPDLEEIFLNYYKEGAEQ